MADNDDSNDRPEEWIADDGPMTDVQRLQLDTLSDETGEPTPGDDLNRSEAAKKIAELKKEAVDHEETDITDLDEP